MKERFAILCRETFRVPLDSQDGQEGVHQPFYNIIPGAADRKQILPWAVYGLMVSGVYQSAAAVELVKEIQSVYITMIHIVHLIPASPFVSVGGIDMLCDVAAEIYIDDLEALADTEHGLPFCCKKGERLKLQNVQLGVNMAGAVITLTEKGGRDVAAPRQEQMGGSFGCFGIQSGVIGDAQSSQDVFVIFGIRGAAQNGDRRKRGHGRFLSRRAEGCYSILCGGSDLATIKKPELF